MTLDLHRLQFLREVAVRGTMTAAAEAMSYTPSAVSQQLATLEREVGVPLLERQGRRVVLTPAGRSLVDGSDDVFAAVERATSAMHAVAGSIGGPVSIGAFQSAGAWLVPAAIRSLREEHPELEVHVKVWNASGLRELELGHLDVCLDQAYALLPIDRHDPFDVRPLLTEPVVLAVPASADLGPDLAAYADATWAMAPGDDECGRLARMVCAGGGVDPDVRFHADDLEVTLQLVAAGLAVAILPRLATFRLPDGVVLHPVADVQRQVLALTRPGVAARPAVAMVLDHLARAGASI